MADERNFRTYYYEKFGIGGVEEKRSIEILLKEQPLNVDKLKQFCLRFPVPAMYRTYLWKVILGIIPANQGSHGFVMKQRTQQYDDLHHAMKLLRRINDQSPVGEMYLKMFLTETGHLPFEEQNLLIVPEYKAFVSMATAVSGIVENDVDGYWITVRFYKIIEKSKEAFGPLPERAKQCLKKEDHDQKLWNHLHKHDVWSYLPLTDWFLCCFSDILPGTAFERIWDKVIGGSFTILVYIAVSIFLTFRRPLLSMNNKENMIKYLTDLPKDSGDVLVTKAIDLWHKHGGHLIQAKSDSPIFVDRSPS